jgi:hypothetical protein
MNTNCFVCGKNVVSYGGLGPVLQEGVVVTKYGRICDQCIKESFITQKNKYKKG